MMGQLAADQNTLFYDFNLEQRIPDNHLLRRIDQFLDFDKIRSHLHSFYSHTGRPSIDPELMIRMLLVGYCYGIRSERRLCEEIDFNLAYRWFCRLGLEDEIPDHSTFSKNRHGRYRDSDIFRFVFETVVQRCIDEHLVKAEGFAIDGSLIYADVSRKNTSRQNRHIDWGPTAQQSRPVKEYLDSLDSEPAKAKRASISLTDPEARWTASRGKSLYAYSTNYMLDIQFGIIVDAEASAGNRANEVACTQSMIERVESNYHIKPKRLLGDTAYGTGELLDWLVEEKQIAPHILVWDMSKRKDGTFSRSDFIWHGAEDYYRCPAGKRLQRSWRTYKKPRTGITKDNTILYHARKQDCDNCKNKPICCPNTPARKVPRSIYEASRDVAREISKSDQFKKQSSAERKKVEMAFAHMKRNLNFHRLRLRGMKSVNDECVLVATVQNLRKLAKYRGQPPPKRRITTSEI
ncbi:MAG: transposase [Gammaproteobacteria bacterium]|nr:transposase [Gammaproteobacteria bacterium]